MKFAKVVLAAPREGSAAIALVPSQVGCDRPVGTVSVVVVGVPFFLRWEVSGMASPKKIPCPLCSGQLTIDDSLKGTTVTCPHCGGNLHIPGQPRAAPTGNDVGLPVIQTDSPRAPLTGGPTTRRSGERQKQPDFTPAIVALALFFAAVFGIIIFVCSGTGGGPDSPATDHARTGDIVTIREGMGGTAFKRDQEEVTDRSRAGDADGLRQMELQGRFVLFESSTRAKVTKTTVTLVRVRALGGPHQGKEVWMPFEFVRK